MNIRVFNLIFAVLLCQFLPAHGMAESNQISKENRIMIRIKTNVGDIDVALNQEKAPKTVENFLQYIADGFFDDTIFHRVIDDFMIQGGGYVADFSQKTTKDQIKNEADNGLKNELGTIAMARTMDPHSATAQFFINLKNNGFLDHKDKSTNGWGYTVFGKVTAGMDIVNKIGKTATGPAGPFSSDVPKNMITIESVIKLDE